eukprot:Gb_31006 [translate_table: standard]
MSFPWGCTERNFMEAPWPGNSWEAPQISPTLGASSIKTALYHCYHTGKGNVDSSRRTRPCEPRRLFTVAAENPHYVAYEKALFGCTRACSASRSGVLGICRESPPPCVAYERVEGFQSICRLVQGLLAGFRLELEYLTELWLNGCQELVQVPIPLRVCGSQRHYIFGSNGLYPLHIF